MSDQKESKGSSGQQREQGQKQQPGKEKPRRRPSRKRRPRQQGGASGETSPKTEGSKPPPKGGRDKRRRRRGRRSGGQGKPKGKPSAQGQASTKDKPGAQKKAGASGDASQKSSSSRPAGKRRRRRGRRSGSKRDIGPRQDSSRQERRDAPTEGKRPARRDAPQEGKRRPAGGDSGFAERRPAMQRRSHPPDTDTLEDQFFTPSEEQRHKEPEPRPEPDPDGEELFRADDLSEDLPRGTLHNMVQVRLRDQAKVSRFDAGEFQVRQGDKVVVETDQGLAVGTAVTPSVRVMSNGPLPRMIRLMDHNDMRQDARNQSREREAFEFCNERIKHRKYPMKLIRVEYLHSGNKAIFFFASEKRVDFRDLVKDLAQRFRVRILMRQIGVRDEARMTGAIGSCGCELCCATWLPKFEPVSIKMAKEQGMVLNPQKVSGQCGRLKCCLVYELEQYMECRRGMPRPGRRILTPEGEGKVQELDILRRIVRVYTPDGTLKSYPADELKPAPQPQRSHQQSNPKRNDKSSRK